MLLVMLRFIQQVLLWKVPLVFSYVSTRMLMAAVFSLLFTIFLGPFFITRLYALKIGQPVRGKDECPLLAKLHEKKALTPTMGGILILAALFLSVILWMDLSCAFSWILLSTLLCLGGIGAVDDYLKLKYKNSKGLRSWTKFLLQTAFACGVAVYVLSPAASGFVAEKTGVKVPVAKEHVHKSASQRSAVLPLAEYASRVYVPFIKGPLFTLGGVAALLFFVFVITGTSNAVNLSDGLDGLAAGCLILVSMVLALVAFLSNNQYLAGYLNILYIENSGEIAVFLTAMVGSLLGFLWYNGHPAQVFMGDTGSLALGGILGVSSVLLAREFLLALSGGIFVAEAFSVILQVACFKWRRKRIFLCAPLHHHFEYKGWPETKVVLRFWIMGLLLAVIGIASLKFQ